MVQLAALWLAAAQVSADELSYQEISTLNINLEPSTNHYDRGDGYLYGASRGKLGANGGMIYRLAPGQPVEVLHEFEWVHTGPMENAGGAGQAYIYAEAPDGALYGLTQTGGAEGQGVLFRYDIDGNLSILDSPTYAGMPTPNSMVVMANGDIYGCSEMSDAHTNGANNWGGCLFRRAADGSVTILHTFTKPAFVPSMDPPGFRPRPPTKPPEPGPFVAPFAPHTICAGPDGNLYGVTWGGGTGRGTFYRFDLTTNTLEVLTDLFSYLDWPKRLIPTEGGFHLMMNYQLLHLAYDGTVKTEINGLQLPNYEPGGADFRSIMETSDGVFVDSAYGGDHDAGYIVRYRKGEDPTVVFHYPYEAREMQRTLTVGPDGKIFGLICYPEDYVPPTNTPATTSSLSATTATDASAKAKAGKKKPAVPNPKSFRFRKAGDSANFMPLAGEDSAWLPAKASASGAREVTVDILANDSDPDRHPLTVTSVTTQGATTATLVQTKRGPRLKVATTEANPTNQRVTYQLSDGNGGTSTGNVAIFSPITATFSGPILPADTELPAGTITVKISGRNVVTATLNLAGKKYTGRGTLDADDTTDIQLKSGKLVPIPLRADLIRSGAQTELQVFLPFGGTAYSATLNTTARGGSR
jgi:uncharacterized repeat protein (TIGR03803 family)